MSVERYLFRGKLLNGGEWVTGHYVHRYDQDRDYIMTGKSALYAADVAHPRLMVEGFEWKWVDPATVGQCTGLKDRNGTLIFEGDILRAPKDITGVVRWNSEYDQRGHTQTCGFVFEVKGRDAGLYRSDLLFWVLDEDKNRKACSGVGVEVAGNVWDNPELLEAGQ